ncbi:28769_t:CDS:2 [Gigaspora margarita]|uniref:28769_t:CDS:1 n=1 Tax=Gigaspora margarita TaxID=4874 RepID=A0ABM8W2F5_GIGMA|nr:28769_t:CDS:2 [Gigaspora margarita]
MSMRTKHFLNHCLFINKQIILWHIKHILNALYRLSSYISEIISEYRRLLTINVGVAHHCVYQNLDFLCSPKTIELPKAYRELEFLIDQNKKNTRPNLFISSPTKDHKIK